MATRVQFQDWDAVSDAIYALQIEVERLAPKSDGTDSVEVSTEELDKRLRRVESSLDSQADSRKATVTPTTKGGAK